MQPLFYHAGKRTCPTASGAVVGSDSPLDCHSLPTLQVLFYLIKQKADMLVHTCFCYAGKRTCPTASGAVARKNPPPEAFLTRALGVLSESNRTKSRYANAYLLLLCG